MTDIPEDISELDGTTIHDLSDCSPGDEMWIPVSMMYGNKFRAAKITIEEKASVNGFEEFHAVDQWTEGARTTVQPIAESHRRAEGIEQC